MYSDLSLLGMTSTHTLRALIAHHGPVPACCLLCAPFSNIFCWRIWSSRSVPRCECYDDVIVGILTDLGYHLKLRDSFWNTTGHKGSTISAASTPSRLSPPIFKGNKAPQTTLSSDQSYEEAGTVLKERPRPLYRLTLGDDAILATNILLSNPRTTSTPTGAGSLFSTNDADHVRDTHRESSIASRSRSIYSSIHTKDPGVVMPSNPRLDHALAIMRNKSSAPAWSSINSTASLTSLSSAIRTTVSGSAINNNSNISANLTHIAAASGLAEHRRLGGFLNSARNGTESRTRISPWLGRRPLYNRPDSLRLPWIGSYATSGLLAPVPPLPTATRGDGVSSIPFNNTQLDQGITLTSVNKNKTNGRILEGENPLEASDGVSLFGFNASTFNQTSHHLGVLSGGPYATNCSGFVTSTAHVVYEVITSTLLVNETITLGHNATTPLPVFITPPPACQIITAPCEGHHCPSNSRRPFDYPKKQPLPVYSQSTTTSTLLVTKKNAAVVRQLSAVGNLFGPTPSTIAAQPSSIGQHCAGQDSGSSSHEPPTQSDDSSSPEPNTEGLPPQESASPQNPTNGNSPSSPSKTQNSDSQKPAAGPSGSQSSGFDDHTPSNINSPNGPASNNVATSDHGDVVSNGDPSGNRGTSSNGGTSNDGNANTDGVASSNGRVLNNGDGSDNEGASSSGDTSSSEGSTSINGAASENGKDSSNGDSPEPEAGSNAGSPGIQYVPSTIMAGNLPVSIISNAVIVGSHTVKVESLPTTVLANGQAIAIQPSQIVAQGKTFPIAAFTPPPANSATIGNLPVVLRPQNLVIGSKTFEHGSTPTSIFYKGQTYSWDVSHLVGAGTTIAFPSMEPSAPRVTAAGQVFSVFPSQLKVPGKNIPIPTIVTASPFVYKGQTFSVNPSQIIAPNTSITLPPAKRVTPFVYIDHTLSVDASRFMARSTTIPLSSGSGILTYNGQVLTIKPSKVIGPSTTIALSAQDDSAALPTAVTTGGLTFSIGPSAAVVGSSTYSFVPGKAPATIETHGEAILVGSNGVQFKNIHIPIPTMTPSFSAITQGGLAFSIAPSKVVIGSHTDTISSDMTPIITVVEGHTLSIGPHGVGLAGTIIPLPAPKPSFSIATRGDITFSVAPSEVVVKDKTYSVASNKAPITTAINGERLTIGPKGIRIEGSTVNLPAIKTPTSITAAGLNFLVGATDVIISGTTYATGSGAAFQTVVVGSQTMGIGSPGAVLPSTTIAPKQTPTAIIAGGLTFSMDSTEAVINATTYAIGSGAVAKTIVKGSTTIILGTDGVALPSTTIRPWSNASQTGFFRGTSDTSSAATVTRALTPIVTGKGSDEKHGAGSSRKIPHSGTLLGLLLGTVLLRLRFI